MLSWVPVGQGRQQAHSEACRRRIEGLLKGDSSGAARLAAADERNNRALADAVERHATNDPGMRGILKRTSVVCHPESEPQKKLALDTEQDSTPHPSVSCGGSSTSGARQSINTNTDQNTSTGDVTREVRTGPAQDVTRTISEDHIRGDVAMRGDGADENTGGHPSSAEPKSRRRITTKREPHEARDEQSSTTEQHLPRRIFAKTAPQERAVAVTTQDALDGCCEKTTRIANVENNTLNWVSILSAGALGMTHCDFSVRLAQDEFTHIIGGSKPDVTIGSEKDQNRECRKNDKDPTELLCESARGRYFVHELTEANSRMKCVAKIMAMPGTRTTVADLCMFGLAACDEGGPGFVKASVVNAQTCIDTHVSTRAAQSRKGNK